MNKKMMTLKSFLFKNVLLKTLVLTPLMAGHAQATSEPNNDVTLNDISWIDNKYFDKKRAVIDDLGRENFGTRLRTSIQDIQLMQRILDGQHVTIFDTETHKALGVVLGDIYVAEQGWQWFEYKDKQGRSSAVCIPKTTHCLFPLSMMTRRLRVSTEHDMARIYKKGLDLMDDVAPKLPYSTQEKIKPEPPKRDKNTIIVPF
ncbi:DUF3806 domain-containing protein [Marinagarivorans algicola]|uniref:DUF3806 domain-containing protein n=1 Tax=Marinagarivorans algicola TaxID=1513270 RepID=UPI0006B627BA|nr:DUF3806 domain-containing protein [Marinagarivorans algicola]